MLIYIIIINLASWTVNKFLERCCFVYSSNGDSLYEAMLFLYLAACQGPTVSIFQRYLIEDQQYRIGESEIPPLTDPVRMIGDYGQIYAGGVFANNFATNELSYEKGRRIRMQYTIQESVFTPLDRDGLILLSFYGHLYDMLKVVEETELETEKLYPLDIAITPMLADPSLAFLPMENAAYVPSVHAFILLSDLSEREVPLAANAGVVVMLASGQRVVGWDKPSELWTKATAFGAPNQMQ